MPFKELQSNLRRSVRQIGNADDPWHPEKTVRQVDLMHAMGARTGFEYICSDYTLFRRIDEHGPVPSIQQPVAVNGPDLDEPMREKNRR
jgi:hypothetical protein